VCFSQEKWGVCFCAGLGCIRGQHSQQRFAEHPAGAEGSCQTVLNTTVMQEDGIEK